MLLAMGIGSSHIWETKVTSPQVCLVLERNLLKGFYFILLKEENTIIQKSSYIFYGREHFLMSYN